MGILRIVASVTARQISALLSRDQGADFYHGLPDHLYPRPLRLARFYRPAKEQKVRDRSRGILAAAGRKIHCVGGERYDRQY